MGGLCSSITIFFLFFFFSLPFICVCLATTYSNFMEAPEYRNGVECSNNNNTIHVAMTLDSEYLRGSIAAINSVLRHASCPQNLFFHLIIPSHPHPHSHPHGVVRNTFPYLAFKAYLFSTSVVQNLISSSIRAALENPLNYARNYLGEILPPDVQRVIYLDSDVVLVDHINKLWTIPLHGNRVIGAPEYCHANFTKYFTAAFWSDPLLSRVFSSKTPCYFNTGVMVMDMAKWRAGRYRQRIEKWMELQKKRKRIYELGSLPPFLLVFAGDIEPIEHRWNQHGLGGDNVRGSCRGLHPGPVSLLHWSGKGKPWVRLDQRRPCPLDYLWQPYDLQHQHHSFD